MKKIFSLLICLLITLTLQSNRFGEPIPDPEKFALKFIEKLKSGDTLMFTHNFNLSRADYNWLTEKALNDPYLSEDRKSLIKDNTEDEIKSSLNQLQNDLTYSDKKIKEWKVKNNIDVSKIEFIRMYYVLRIDRESNLYVLDDVNVFVKMDSLYFGFQFHEIAFIKNDWVGGDLEMIYEANQYLEMNYEEPEYLTADTVAVVAADTVPYQSTEYYEAEEPSLTDKQKKIQKKISRYQDKIDKLYEKMYQEE